MASKKRNKSSFSAVTRLGNEIFISESCVNRIGYGRPKIVTKSYPVDLTTFHWDDVQMFGNGEQVVRRAVDLSIMPASAIKVLISEIRNRPSPAKAAKLPVSDIRAQRLEALVADRTCQRIPPHEYKWWPNQMIADSIIYVQEAVKRDLQVVHTSVVGRNRLDLGERVVIPIGPMMRAYAKLFFPGCELVDGATSSVTEAVRAAEGDLNVVVVAPCVNFPSDGPPNIGGYRVQPFRNWMANSQNPTPHSFTHMSQSVIYDAMSLFTRVNLHPSKAIRSSPLGPTAILYYKGQGELLRRHNCQLVLVTIGNATSKGFLTQEPGGPFLSRLSMKVFGAVEAVITSGNPAMENLFLEEALVRSILTGLPCIGVDAHPAQWDPSTLARSLRDIVHDVGMWIPCSRSNNKCDLFHELRFEGAVPVDTRDGITIEREYAGKYHFHTFYWATLAYYYVCPSNLRAKVQRMLKNLCNIRSSLIKFGYSHAVRSLHLFQTYVSTSDLNGEEMEIKRDAGVKGPAPQGPQVSVPAGLTFRLPVPDCSGRFCSPMLPLRDEDFPEKYVFYRYHLRRNFPRRPAPSDRRVFLTANDPAVDLSLVIELCKDPGIFVSGGVRAGWSEYDFDDFKYALAAHLAGYHLLVDTLPRGLFSYNTGIKLRGDHPGTIFYNLVRTDDVVWSLFRKQFWDMPYPETYVPSEKLDDLFGEAAVSAAIFEEVNASVFANLRH
jgi:hypothetical protein